MPCNSCHNEARCANFGVCQAYRFPLKEAKTASRDTVQETIPPVEGDGVGDGSSDGVAPSLNEQEKS